MENRNLGSFIRLERESQQLDRLHELAVGNSREEEPPLNWKRTLSSAREGCLARRGPLLLVVAFGAK